jgi:hypothetical protein
MVHELGHLLLGPRSHSPRGESCVRSGVKGTAKGRAGSAIVHASPGHTYESQTDLQERAGDVSSTGSTSL